jgi:hypothetical protein
LNKTGSRSFPEVEGFNRDGTPPTETMFDYKDEFVAVPVDFLDERGDVATEFGGTRQEVF